MKKIIVAVDSFKGSMTSLEAGNAIRNGIKDIHPDWNITVYPVADGGQGTLEALTYHQSVTERTCTVTGRKSDFSLYDYGLATYDAADTFNHQSAKGFIDLYGLSTRVWAKNRREQGVTDGEEN